MIKKIKVGLGSCGIAAGAQEVYNYLQSEIKDIEIISVGCIGHCYAEPLVEVETESGSLFFDHMSATPKDLKRLLDLNNPFKFNKNRSNLEKIKVTKLAGVINPISFDEYIDNGGYEALKKALSLSRDELLNEIIKSGLRGRGGGGFPTGMKWRFLSAKEESHKVLICNADEGDPGAFMDRSMMESVPHQVLEGMLIGALATGATELIIYVRAEYPLAVKNLSIAIEQIYSNSLNNLNGKTVSIKIKEGAGAFVCGEETAMINSLEGKRGTPRFRPPYPTDKGYLGHPTAINNVETFANIPIILVEGGETYALDGTQGSKGTKLFALAGDIPFPGLVEVPMGITIGEIIYDIGGAEKGSVKAVQTGGPSGGCIPETYFDTPVDYDSLKALGAIMGSGGLIAIGKNRCMVETARYFLEFTAKESCGKCTFCRVGTTRMLETLERITGGEGVLEDIQFLEDIAPKIIKGSLCGLGQTAPNPVLASLKYFKHEFIEHVSDKKCLALQCNPLVDVYLDQSKCIECGACVKTCPVSAISKDYVVDNSICTRCNSCIEICPKKTIYRRVKGGVNG
ncbi:4Fe-4S binding protein [bacterium]|nr:4Fe-4S binding protein [bacterium]